jgi:hypothetical protein
MAATGLERTETIQWPRLSARTPPLADLRAGLGLCGASCETEGNRRAVSPLLVRENGTACAAIRFPMKPLTAYELSICLF